MIADDDSPAPPEPQAEPDPALGCLSGDDAVLHGDYSDRIGPRVDNIRAYRVVTGSIDLTGTLPLPCLERVDGDLILTIGRAVHGLERLEHIGGRLIIDGQGAQTMGVQGLSALQSVGGDLYIVHSQYLRTLEGFEQLRSIEGDFLIEVVPLLQSLEGLRGLTRIGGALSILAGSATLKSLHGLEQLTDLGGLGLAAFDGLTSLEGLAPLTRIRGDVTFTQLPAFSSLGALSALERIDGTLRFELMQQPIDLSPLSNLTELGGLSIVSANVPTLAPLSRLRTLGTLDLQAGPTDLQGLHNLTSLDNLYVFGGLTSLAGLQQITSLATLYIRSSGLESMRGLDNLETITGDATFTENGVLTSLAGLGKLRRVGGNLSFDYNSALGNLTGLEALEQVDGALNVARMPGLTSLAGLSALTRPAALFIAANPVLVDVSALPPPAAPLAALSVYQNPWLSRCQAESLAAVLDTTCSCPESSTDHCVPGCSPSGTKHASCTLCNGPSYCTCDGTCNCVGNNNLAICAP